MLSTELIANSPTPGTVAAIATLGSGGLTSAATSMPSGTGAPPTALQSSTGQFRIVIDSEIIIASYSSGAWGSLTRGAEGSTAASHSGGASIYHDLTAGGLTAFVDQNAGLQVSGSLTSGNLLKSNGTDAEDSGIAASSVSTAITEAAAALPKSGGTMSGAIAMGSNKITGLANGTASTDAAAYGQIPTSLPPDGSAGGDLSGTYPNPGVANLHGVPADAVTTKGDLLVANSTPDLKRLGVGADGYVLTARSSAPNGVDWEAAAGGLPSGGSVGQVVTNTGPGTGDWEWTVENVIRVKDHGAKGDLKLGTEATTNGTTTVTLADASLTSGDVGKYLVINKAGNNSSGNETGFRTTISSVTDSTHCVVATAPPVNVSSLEYAYGTDDTAAFQAAITAGQALGVSQWTLELDDIGYMIAGSYVTTSNYNAQITLPTITNALNRVTIEIRGTSWRPQVNPSQPVTGRGPMMFTAQTGQEYGTGSPWGGTTVGLQSMIGGPATHGPFGDGNFTQVCPVVRGVTFLGPHWNPTSLLDFGTCQQAIIEDCYFGGNEVDTEADPGWKTNCGFIMPQNNNNNACWIRNITIKGQVIGLLAGEHTNGENIFIYQCAGGVAVSGWQGTVGHLISFPNLDTEHCIYHITAWDPNGGGSHGIQTSANTAGIQIGGWTVEDAASGTYATSQHVNNSTSFRVDVANARRGVAGTGIVSGGWLVANGSACRILDSTLPRGPQTSLPSVPASGTAFSTIWRDAIYVFTSASNVSGITINTVGSGLGATGSVIQVFVPSGLGIVLTYSSTPTLAGLIII